jgi:DNA helicase IV
LKDWLNKQIDEAEKLERTKPWVQEEIELLSNEDYHKAYTHLRKKRRFKGESLNNYENEIEALGQLIVRQKLKPLRKRIRTLRFIGFKGIYKQLFADHTIAIICKSAAESTAAYEALSNVEEVKLVKSESTEYEQGVVVIPAYLAKGIEFDAVIIYNASAQVYGDESLRRLFYTACTRAMHYLQLYSVGEPSPFCATLSRGVCF